MPKFCRVKSYTAARHAASSSSIKRKFVDKVLVPQPDVRNIGVGGDGQLTIFQREEHTSADDFATFWNCKPAERATMKLYGKHIVLPRWTRAYDRDYHFSGKTHAAADAEFPQAIKQIIDSCMERAQRFNSKINGCLVNWYDAEGSIGQHHDNERQLARDQDGYVLPIVMFSFGGDREFVLTPDKNETSSLLRVNVKISDGSVVVMDGLLNKNYFHSVPEANHKECDPNRISLTFRAFV